MGWSSAPLAFSKGSRSVSFDESNEAGTNGDAECPQCEGPVAGQGSGQRCGEPDKGECVNDAHGQAP